MLSPVAVACGAVLFVVAYIALSVTVVPAGTVGVVDVFGEVRDEPLQAGMNFVFPLASVCRCERNGCWVSAAVCECLCVCDACVYILFFVPLSHWYVLVCRAYFRYTDNCIPQLYIH